MLPIYHYKKTVFNYDEIPAGYYYHAMQSGSAVQRFWHREKFAAVLSRLPEGKSFLDLGCGPGSFIHRFHQSYPDRKIIGVDIASGQLEFAKQLMRQAENVNFQSLSLDSHVLPFDDSNFDAVSCIEVIEHIHPRIAYKMLREVRRVLKPGGQLIITTPNYRSLWPMIEMLLEKFSEVKYHDQHINKFTPNSFVKFLEIAGFEVRSLDSFFIIAPFLAGLSEKAARMMDRIENFKPNLYGSILIGVCVASSDFD